MRPPRKAGGNLGAGWSSRRAPRTRFNEAPAKSGGEPADIADALRAPIRSFNEAPAKSGGELGSEPFRAMHDHPLQ